MRSGLRKACQGSGIIGIFRLGFLMQGVVAWDSAAGDLILYCLFVRIGGLQQWMFRVLRLSEH